MQEYTIGRKKYTIGGIWLSPFPAPPSTGIQGTPLEHSRYVSDSWVKTRKMDTSEIGILHSMQQVSSHDNAKIITVVFTSI